jgi:DNA-binding PadR family transcriptional regulator
MTRTYLRNLISKGFVNVIGESKGRKVYLITEKGKEWLRVYKSLLALEKLKD